MAYTSNCKQYLFERGTKMLNFNQSEIKYPAIFADMSQKIQEVSKLNQDNLEKYHSQYLTAVNQTLELNKNLQASIKDNQEKLFGQSNTLLEQAIETQHSQTKRIIEQSQELSQTISNNIKNIMEMGTKLNGMKK